MFMVDYQYFRQLPLCGELSEIGGIVLKGGLVMKNIISPIRRFLKLYSWLLYLVIFTGFNIYAIIELSNRSDMIKSGVEMIEMLSFYKLDLNDSSVLIGSLGYTYVTCFVFAFIKFALPTLFSIIFSSEDDGVVYIGKNLNDIMAQQIGTWFISKLIQIVMSGLLIFICAFLFWWVDFIYSLIQFIKNNNSVRKGAIHE